MAINFDSLPNDGGFALIPKGAYKLKIEAAEMKQGKDTTKPMYLSLRFAAFDKDGNKIGSFFDTITESDAQIARYKLRRFLVALNLNLPTFELRDLVKIIVGKELIGDVIIETPEGYRAKNVIDALSDEIFYSLDTPPEGFNTPVEGGADHPAESDGEPESAY